MAFEPVRITPELLLAVAPKLPRSTAESYAVHLDHAARKYHIDTSWQVSTFVAQLAHETGGFRWLREIWGPTAQQRRYDPPGTLAEQLGNTRNGDGSLYRGRGFIMITGKANYDKFGRLIHVDLVSNPRLAESPAIAAEIAGAFWRDRRLNDLLREPTLEAFNKATRLINGGTNGAAERIELWITALRHLGIDPISWV